MWDERWIAKPLIGFRGEGGCGGSKPRHHIRGGAVSNRSIRQCRCHVTLDLE